MKNDPRNALLYLAAVAAFCAAALYGCPADARITRVTVFEDTALLDHHCPHDAACRVGHKILLPGKRGLVCDRPVAVVVQKSHDGPLRRSHARWHKGAIHMVKIGWHHPRMYQLGDALQRACDYWRPATAHLWGHELLHVLGRRH